MHDPRLGRFLSLYPLYKEFPANSPYGFAENKAISYKEIEGAFGSWCNENIFEPLGDGALIALNFANSIAENTVSSVVLTTTGVIMPIINQTSVIIHEGVHEGPAYDESSKVSWAVPYKVEGWRLVRKDYSDFTDFDNGGKEVMMSTLNTLLLVAPLKVNLPVSGGSKLTNQLLNYGASQGANATLKKTVEIGLDATQSSSGPEELDAGTVNIKEEEKQSGLEVKPMERKVGLNLVESAIL